MTVTSVANTIQTNVQGTQAAQRDQPVGRAQPDVQQHHVGTVLADQVGDRQPVVTLGDHLDVPRARQDRAQPATNQVLVVGKQDLDHDTSPGRVSTVQTLPRYSPL